jgi:polyphosphate glucokinase
MTNKILGIDIGGSAIKGAPVETQTGLLLAERHRIKTPEPVTPAKMAKLVAEIVGHFHWRGPIGIGFPGVVQGARILTSANMHKGFIGLDAGKLFSSSTGCRVALINDAAAAGLAEMTFGAGRNVGGKVLMLTLGTGVGSVLFHRGAVFPCELGHLPFKGKDAEKIVAASVRKKKDLSWREWSRELNSYLSLLENILWPELVIIGGGVSAKHEKFFHYLKLRTKVVPAEFFNQAGIVGAARWAGQAAKQPGTSNIQH